MGDVLEVAPEFRVTAQVRRAASDCCGAKLNAVGGVTQHWECRACGRPCDLVLSGPEEVTGG